jgi:hypothetical protein
MRVFGIRANRENTVPGKRILHRLIEAKNINCISNQHAVAKVCGNKSMFSVSF